MLSLCAFGALGCTTPAAYQARSPVINPWPEVATPQSGRPESIGTYAAGCLAGAVPLPMVGLGFRRVSTARNRHYGHPALIVFLERLGKETHTAREEDFLIGDLGLPKGGPTLSGHASHQIGLDVDLWFQRSSPPARSVIDARTGKVDPSLFSIRQRALLRRASESDAVERIFVNPAIKRELCAKEPRAAWIRKIRPWFGHDYHFHVRLHCPSESRFCTEGEALPLGNGCDETLRWWESDEARAVGKEKMQNPLELPNLPENCASVLRETERSF